MLDRTNFLPELKDYYHDERTKMLIYKNRPLVGMLPKRTDWDGANWELPIQHGVSQGFSSDFATAKANKAPSVHKRFSIPLKKYYGLADIDNALIATSRTDAGSFLRAVKNELDGMIIQFGNETAHGVYGDGSGLRATATADEETATVTFPVSEIIHFEVGMEIQSSAAADGTGLNAAVTVNAVDRTAGTVTFSGAPGAVLDIYFYREGDGGAKIQGLKAWLVTPLDAAAYAALSTPFNGVDRSADPTRLAGLYYDGSGESIEDAVIKAGATAFTEGARPEIVVMNPLQVAQLDRDIESGTKHRSRFDKVASADAELGFDSIRFHTGAGLVDVVADPYCPVDRAYMLDLSTWSVRSAGTWGRFLDEGAFDQGRLRNDLSDSLEFRYGGYGNMGCSAPGKNLVIALPALP